MKRVFGIDFGTTSSAVVGVLIDDDVRIIKYGEEGSPIPSIVAIDKETGEITTGRAAWKQRQTLSENCEIITSVKTYLEDPKYCRIVAGKEWYPIDVARELFKSLKKAVYERTSEDMTEATVSIPVGFSAEKRDILRKAALDTGVYITSFVSEPTAAFFSNYQYLKSCNNVVVFDWGGGTLDVSVLQNKNGNIYELSKAGLDIAGDKFDDKIARDIHSRISKKKGIEIAFDDMPLNCQDKLRVISEQAKRNLSSNTEASVYAINYGPYGIVNETLTYEQLCNIVQPEIEMALDCLKEAIDQSKIGLPNINRIVLVGGSSKLKILKERMLREYGDLLYSPDEPDWDIGQGAALLSLEKGDNYSNQSVGIILSDNTYYEFLGKDTKLNNWSKTYNFAVTDSSDCAQFVFDGSPDIRELPDRYRTINVDIYKFLQEKIKVHVSVDENLIFTVTACSSMKPNKYEQVWTYTKLKCYYKLPL